jgi:hypothetical protein
MSNLISSELRHAVATRANFVCEYCLIAEEDSFFRFQIEHIISRKHGGGSEPDNLAFACVYCNRYKGSDIATVTPDTQELVRLYNPRTDRWREHFQLNELSVKPLSLIGEATIRILQINHDDRRLEREILARCDRYPSIPALKLINQL